MNSPRLRPLAVLLLVVFALLSSACGSVAKVREAAERQRRTNDLKQVGLAYMNYFDAFTKGPAKAEDLLPFIDNDAMLLQRIKDDYTIIWSVNMKDPMLMAQGWRNTILGYENTTPTAGGLVVMCDGSVQQMTAAEFNAKPKAKSGDGGKGK